MILIISITHQPSSHSILYANINRYTMFGGRLTLIQHVDDSCHSKHGRKSSAGLPGSASLPPGGPKNSGRGMAASQSRDCLRSTSSTHTLRGAEVWTREDYDGRCALNGVHCHHPHSPTAVWKPPGAHQVFRLGEVVCGFPWQHGCVDVDASVGEDGKLEQPQSGVGVGLA